jgi:hypothetical protein
LQDPQKLIQIWIFGLKTNHLATLVVTSTVLSERAIEARQVWLPDGIFLYKKFHFGKIFEGLAREGVRIFYCHFVYFMAIWYILWPFGMFVGHFDVFSHLGIFCQEKSGNPDAK